MSKKKTQENMTAIPKSIEGILADNPHMKIPIFQRDYSWKSDNWRELWNDIFNGIKNDTKHYLGSVVLVNNGDSKEVVDGQQRLTTISIIYLAIISNFNDLINNGIDVAHNSTRAQEIKKLICETDLYSISSTNKLQLNENNNMIYAKYLVDDKIPEEGVKLSESNRLLVECFKYFKKSIKKHCTIDGEKHPDYKLLLDYFTYISGKLLIIEIVASDYHNAYVIFETLNDRGLDLTVTDLLKNYLFSLAKISKHNDIKKAWNEIINNVDEKNTTKFIRHFWNSYHKKVTEKELFRAIKDEIKDEEKVINFILKLSEISSVYSALSNPNNQLWNGDEYLKESLKEINLYKVDLCFPVLLSAQMYLSDLKLKRKIFKLCSRISFRYIVICNGSANDLERAYNDLCLNIFNNKDEIKIELIEKEMKEFIVPSEAFIASFKNKSIKTKNNKRLIMDILKGIERNRGSKIGEDYTIEHILPEHYDSDWDEKFNKDSEEYKYRLGNYILLEKDHNNGLGNKPFSEKKTVYKESIFEGAKVISELKDWTIDELENHQQKMAKIVNTVWGV